MLVKCLLLVVLGAAAIAQTASDGLTDRTFHFAQAETTQARQEILNAIRSIGEIRYASVDLPAGMLAVRATPVQIDLAQWLFGELDRSAQPGAAESYQMAADPVPYVRTFFLVHTTGPREIQEMVNSMRSIGEIQRVVVYTPSAAVVVRGSFDQVELAAWLVRQLDQPAGVQSEEKPAEYTYNDLLLRFPATAVRAFRLAHATNPQTTQEIVNTVRSIAQVQRITFNTAVATVVSRSTPVQASLAAWLIQQLDRQAEPRTATAITEFPPGLAGLMPAPAPSMADQTVKVAALAHVSSPQAAQELVNRIRSTAGMQRVVYTSLPRAVTLCGTANQMAEAERLIQEADRQ
jgi:hypothetical protein